MAEQIIADKILLLTLDFPPNIGGVACYYQGLCGALKNKIIVLTIHVGTGRDQSLQCSRDQSLQSKNLEFDKKQKYKIYRRKLEAKKKILGFLPRWIVAIYHTFQIEEKEKIKFLMVGNILPLGYVAYLFKIIKKKPYVVLIHGYDILLAITLKWKKFWTKLVLKNSQLIIANSQFTKKQIIKNYQIAENKIRVIYPCVSEELVNMSNVETRHSLVSKTRQRLVSTGCKFYLLSVARLNQRKNLDAVIKSLPQIIKIIPTLKYIIVGDGPDKERLKSIVNQLNLSNYVQFVGAKAQDQLAEYYQQSDIFILTPRQIGPDIEGFGIVYLEANLFGKPVIGSKTGGVPEAVINGKTGLLVGNKNFLKKDNYLALSSEISQAIIRLYQDSALRQKLGKQGRERVLKEFRRRNQTQFTILMFSMSSFWEWQSGIRNRNFFILRELINRPEVVRVIMVNYLPWNFKRAIKEFINLKFKISPAKIFSKNLGGQENNSNLAIEQFNNTHLNIYQDLTSKLYQVNEKLFIYSTIDPFFSKQTFIKKLKNILISPSVLAGRQYLNISRSKLVLWSYYPLFIDYYTQIPADLKIFDAVDDWRAHPSYLKQKDLLDNNYQKIKQQADIIFTVSRYLKESLFENQKNVYVVPNGADISIQSFNSKFKINVSKPVIGYVGNIQSRLDFNLIKFLAVKNPDKLFIFVGKVWADVDFIYNEVKNFKNVQFFGAVPYQNLPQIISQFDIAIVPHKINNLTKSMDPMKIYEYLSYGLPVVATAVIDSANFAGLVDITQSNQEFNHKLNQSLHKKQDHKFRQDALDFVHKNTWEKREQDMMEIIKRKF